METLIKNVKCIKILIICPYHTNFPISYWEGEEWGA